jgi:hypothetical protein
MESGLAGALMAGLGGIVGGADDMGFAPFERLCLRLDLGRGWGQEASASINALNELSRSRSGTAHGKRRRTMQTC